MDNGWDAAAPEPLPEWRRCHASAANCRSGWLSANSGRSLLRADDTSDRHRFRQDAAGQRSRLPSICSKTDADGRDIAGVHLPTLAASIATHTGWNFRKSGFAEGELCDNNGSMFPFAATREERVKNNDPRLSLAERYPREGDRAAAVLNSAKQLVQDRLLLEQDVKLFMTSIN